MAFKITATELELLDVLWSKYDGERGVTSREVSEHLQAKGRDISQTAVITIFTNLVDKGYVDSVKIRRKKAHEYIPLITREEYNKYAVKDLMNKACLGSQKVMLSALFEAPISEEQYNKIRDIIRDSHG